MPLFAPAAVPSSVAEQPVVVATRSIPLTLPLVTPEMALNVFAFSTQGRPCTATLTPIVPIVQPLKEALVTEPMPVPDRPLPLFSVPPILIEVHFATVLVVASLTWPHPLALMEPPGVTVPVALTLLATAAVR